MDPSCLGDVPHPDPTRDPHDTADRSAPRFPSEALSPHRGHSAVAVDAGASSSIPSRRQPSSGGGEHDGGTQLGVLSYAAATMAPSMSVTTAPPTTTPSTPPPVTFPLLAVKYVARHGRIRGLVHSEQ